MLPGGCVGERGGALDGSGKMAIIYNCMNHVDEYMNHVTH